MKAFKLVYIEEGKEHICFLGAGYKDNKHILGEEYSKGQPAAIVKIEGVAILEDRKKSLVESYPYTDYQIIEFEYNTGDIIE